ncbi:MAG: YcjF family protein [Gloeomargarita sp. HHBFW_bins_162]
MSWWWQQLRRYPLLSVGVTGSMVLWVWQSWGHELTTGAGVLGGVLVLLLLRQRWFARQPMATAPVNRSELTRQEVITYLEQLHQELTDLEQEMGSPQPDLHAHYQELTQALEMPLSLAWAGTFTSSPLPDDPFPVTTHHPAWVLYGIQERLTSEQLTELTAYLTQEQPVQVIWCAAAWPDAQVRLTALEQLQGIGYTQPVLTITLHPPAILVRKIQSPDTWEDSWEIPPPVLEELTQWLNQRRQEPHWQYQAMVRRGKQFHTLMQKRQQAYRTNQAERVIQRYQVGAAVWAGVNPVPSLDVLATGAINAQMLVDLAQVYRRSLTLNQAQAMVRALAPMLVQMGAVEWVTTLAGTWLKTHWATYAVGGAMQAISAAYLTHVAGHTFLEHLRAPERELNLGVWQSLRTRVFATGNALHFWKQFVPQSLPWLTRAGVAVGNETAPSWQMGNF